MTPEAIKAITADVAAVLAARWPSLALLPEFADVVDQIAQLIAVARDNVPVAVTADRVTFEGFRHEP